MKTKYTLVVLALSLTALSAHADVISNIIAWLQAHPGAAVPATVARPGANPYPIHPPGLPILHRK
jgi:hypothetical protein